jgi:nicotinamide phosphoribosyltransferase
MENNLKKLNPMCLTDFYKLFHRVQYPPGTEVVYSTWTPRSTRLPGVDAVVVFGLQGFIQEWLIDYFNDNFFDAPIDIIVDDYARTVGKSLGIKDVETQHIRDLHFLGYLPLLIKALPEGSRCPIRCPAFTVHNTDKKFAWLTNNLETLMSSELWLGYTSATIADQYRQLLNEAAMLTVGNTDFVPFQGHDFSMRGLSSISAASRSGAAHLTSFQGTDTVPAIPYLEQYYGANVDEELVGTSIPATEHSVMCAYEDDMVSFKRLINDVYPTGFLSVVSDTWDLWDVIGRVLPLLKDDIMARDGKLVIRPDSGDPVKIICGDSDAQPGTMVYKGVIECLWDLFGGTLSPKGFKLLDSHIGAIYGDSITIDRARQIVNLLYLKGFASINCVFGIGSFTYQYNTRDTFGFALKSTVVVVNGQERHIFKNPKTDDGTKKSQKGRVVVLKDGYGDYYYEDELPLHGDITGDQLKVVFEDGFRIGPIQTLSEIRARIQSK